MIPFTDGPREPEYYPTEVGEFLGLGGGCPLRFTFRNPQHKIRVSLRIFLYVVSPTFILRQFLFQVFFIVFPIFLVFFFLPFHFIQVFKESLK